MNRLGESFSFEREHAGQDLQIVEILHAGLGDSEFHERFEFSGNHRFFWLGGVRDVPRHAYSFPPTIILVAGQLAAAFGTLRQGGTVPAAAEGLDEPDRAHHASAKNIDGADFVGECGALSGSHFEITRDAASVAGDGEVQVLLGGIDCILLNLSFVLEDPQCRNVVFHLLETG